MIIVKKLEWFRPYIQSIEHLVPKIKKLRRISAKSGSKERWQHAHGIVSFFNDNSFRITLYTSYHDMVYDKLKPYDTIDLLQYLAHELAHLEHWEHTPQHKHLEVTIMSTFMTRLAQDGYISQEDEMKNGMFYRGK
jgi:hypothetical protein